MQCPRCGTDDQTGKYCAECGAALDTTCASCGAGLPPGARFCTRCGESVGGGAGTGGYAPGSKAAWIIAPAVLLVVLLVLFLPREADRIPAPLPGDRTAPSVGGGTGGGGLGGLSSDMRTNGDRLFNRVMAAAERGEQAEVEQFLPMAIQAYEMVDDLDDDRIYHLAILHLTNDDPAAARRAAQRILDRSPNHLLALGAAATAAEEAGDDDEARSLWTRFLEAHSEESAQLRQEYLDHQAMVDEYHSQAQSATP